MTVEWSGRGAGYCRHAHLMDGHDLTVRKLYERGYLGPLYGLPNLPGGLPIDLHGLVTPSHRAHQVGVCLSCNVPMVWDEQGNRWRVWGPTEPVDGRRRTTHVRSQAWADYDYPPDSMYGLLPGSR